MSYFETAELLLNRALEATITNADIELIVQWPQDKLPILFSATDQVRRHFFTNTVDPCTLLNIKSGDCSEDCAFCAQSGHNHATVTVSPLVTKQQILDAARAAHSRNCSFCVVSSGRKLSPADIATVCEAIKELDGPVHASLGILTDEEFRQLRKAGVCCYNHNLETSREFFPKIVTTHTWEERAETVRRATRCGMRVCCGGIFGMGESWQDRISLCQSLRELDVDTIPLNFLNALPGTRVSKPQESPLDFLKIVSLFRLVHPRKTIKVCGGRELHLGKLQGLMFLAGANGYVAGDYLTTKGDSIESDDAMVAALGLRKEGH